MTTPPDDRGAGGAVIGPLPLVVAPEVVPAAETKRAPAAPDRSTEPAAGPPSVTRPRSWRWRYGFPAALVVLVIAIPVLIFAGSKTVLSSTSGRFVRTVTDPAAPGWQAVVEATPTELVVMLDEQGRLNGLTLLSLTGEGVGGVVQLSALTLAPNAPGEQDTMLYETYRTQGLPALVAATERVLGTSVGSVDTIEPQEWAGLVGPVSPIAVSNPDPVSKTVDGVTQVVFPKGTIDIPADQVWTYLSTLNPGENDLNRQVRLGAFWHAWFQKVDAGADQPGVVPGEVDSGLGRFVRTLARDQVQYANFPVSTLRVPGSTLDVFLPRVDEGRVLMAAMVPLPHGPEGTRVRLTVLDGTGRLDHGLAAATKLAGNGGQIEKIGNATSFDEATTQFIYYDEAQRPAVQKLRDALGVGELVKSADQGAVVDATVTLGADYLAVAGGAGG